MVRSRLIVAVAFLLVGVGGVTGSQAGAAPGKERSRPPHRIVQEAAVNWHPQSGSSGPVADAEATLIRGRHGISYRFSTHGLVAGNAYTVWLVVVNDPGQCAATPCDPPTDIIGNPATDSQVTFAKAGTVARSHGSKSFRAQFRAGPLLDGWLPVQGLDDPMGAEVHIIVNDHGPVIDGLRHEMTSTYRAGCTDASLPAFFPPRAKADGTPGPNQCRLYQAAIFLPPSS